MKRLAALGIIIVLVLCISPSWAQKAIRLAIATGGKGGVYYPIGVKLSEIINKYIHNTEVMAETTGGSAENGLFIGSKKADIAFILADTGWNAYRGKAPFKERIPVRTIAALYPSNLYLVTLEERGIEKIADIKGKNVSTGGPGTVTETMAVRVLEAYGLSPNKDIKRQKILFTEAVGALRDKKIDAFFWAGGLSPLSLIELGMPPGAKIKLIDQEEVISKIRGKYGPFYTKGVIPAKTYPEQDKDIAVPSLWNLLVCREEMMTPTVYDITKAIFEHKSEWVNSRGDEKDFSLESQAAAVSPIPFHPGAVQYFAEKGIKIK